jgi:hypothetical protein
MPGLDPGIQAVSQQAMNVGRSFETSYNAVALFLDGRVKPGHDAESVVEIP